MFLLSASNVNTLRHESNVIQSKAEINMHLFKFLGERLDVLIKLSYIRGTDFLSNRSAFTVSKEHLF